MTLLQKYPLGKKILTVAIIGGLAYGGFAYYKSRTATTATTKYAFASVKKGTLIVAVSGSGQIVVADQVDIKAKASGDLISLSAKTGQEVKAGTVLATIDASEAQKAVRDAQTSLETAQLSLAKLKQPLDALTLMQAENSLTQAQESKANAQANLIKTREDGFSAAADAFLVLPATMTGLNDVLYGTDLVKNGQANIDAYYDAVKDFDARISTYKNDAEVSYRKAKLAYDANFTAYKSSTRFSDNATIDSLISQSYDTSKLIADALKSANNYVQFYQDRLTERNIKVNPVSNTHLSTLSSNIGKIDGQLTSLLGIQNSIRNDSNAIVSADRSIVEKTASLAKLKAGPDALDIRNLEITVAQRQNSLLDAREKLADYAIRAPFEGVIADVKVKRGDTVSAGTSIATLITVKKMAEVSLNEVDAAKVAVGQKATLTFDAIPDLTISGEVSDVSSLGTVSQGVVTYDVQIAFDAQDDRVKPSMSVSASIITEAKSDVLLVPNSAIKQQGGTAYVEAPTEADKQAAEKAGNAGIEITQPLDKVQIETGLSNDTSTEVISGLNEGELIVIRTIQPTTAAAATSGQQNSLFRIPGVGGATTGAARGGGNATFSR